MLKCAAVLGPKKVGEDFKVPSKSPNPRTDQQSKWGSAHAQWSQPAFSQLQDQSQSNLVDDWLDVLVFHGLFV